MPGLGPSKAAALMILWSPIAEISTESSHSRATIHLQTGEGGAFFQQQSGHRALETDCEPTVWEEGVCVQFPSHRLFVPDSGLALYQRISSAFSLLLFETEGSALHTSSYGGEGRTSQILNKHLTF